MRSGSLTLAGNSPEHTSIGLLSGAVRAVSGRPMVEVAAEGLLGKGGGVSPTSTTRADQTRSPTMSPRGCSERGAAFGPSLSPNPVKRMTAT
jgi:hypothetical protein